MSDDKEQEAQEKLKALIAAADAAIAAAANTPVDQVRIAQEVLAQQARQNRH